MNLPFSLPAPPGHTKPPNWDGLAFFLGDERTPVLNYSENFTGWSDDLTKLHEEAAGDSHPIDLASRKDALKQVVRYLPAGSGVIIEVGCSSGFLLKDLIKSFPRSVVVGADVVKQPLLKLAKELPGVPLIRFDLLQCPLPDKIADILIMLNVIEHIEDDIIALKNAFKLLKPGGTLILEVPAGPSLYDQYDAELNHFRRYSATELKLKLTAVGFKLLRLSHLGFVLYPAFVAVKLLNRWLPFKRRGKLVRDQATSTSESLLFKHAMGFESNHLANLKLPFGVRVLAVARRPQ